MESESKTDKSRLLRLSFIASKLGVSIQELEAMDLEDIQDLVLERTGPLKHSVSMGNLIPRGNPLLAMGKYLDTNKLLLRFNDLFA